MLVLKRDPRWSEKEVPLLGPYVGSPSSVSPGVFLNVSSEGEPPWCSLNGSPKGIFQGGLPNWDSRWGPKWGPRKGFHKGPRSLFPLGESPNCGPHINVESTPDTTVAIRGVRVPESTTAIKGV
jgi:hypothetical protein